MGSNILTVPISHACNIIYNPNRNDSDIKGCKDIETVYRIIEETIYVGAPIYNEGNPLGCFQVYEGAAYYTNWAFPQLRDKPGIFTLCGPK